ncbi:amino acid adenylation domain-containing protein [Streptomyces sp. NPDC059917]|uniref:amino acid adenylation domain-containing protein n=1 Tax=Streptomyces sp. NPDC059917 TaxID=3347002 RepID=UPI0036562530
MDKATSSHWDRVRAAPAEPVDAPRGSAPAATVLPDLFEQAVLRWPDAIAIDLPPSSGRLRRRLTYAQLGIDVDLVARAVVALVGQGRTVAVLLARNTELLYTAQLGALRAGCAHVCVDPVSPDAYVMEILTDAAPAVVLTDHEGELRLRGAGFAGRLLRVDQPCPLMVQDLPASRDADTPAYLVYTSGTTGPPKGVVVAHRGITALIRSDTEEFGLGPGDRIAQGSSSAYDSSLEETWMALASGATLVVMDEEAVRLGPDLVPWLRRERVTVLCPPPTLLRATSCADPRTELPDLRLVYTGGEPLPPDIADTWSRVPRLVNGYGPTECSVTCVRQDVVPGEPIAIGRPVPGMEAWVLDAGLQPVAPGERGELCMSGSGLALGYLNRPELTAERFVEHPAHGRLYRTGDLVHQQPDGSLICHGRIDAQVKLRGHRIELEAVEASLARCPGVREVACRIQGDGPTQMLVAHIVAIDGTHPPDTRELTRQLTSLLPPPMVPTRYGFTRELPRGGSGKLRREVLPDLEPPPSACGRGPIEARNRAHLADPCADNAEARILVAVAQATGVPAPDADADFFLDLGGTSLHAALLVSQLRTDAVTSSLAVRDVYADRTIRRLAVTSEQRRARTTSGSPGPAPEATAAPPAEMATASDVARATAWQSAWVASELLLLSVPACLFAFWALPLLLLRFGPLPLLLLAPPLLTALSPFLVPPALLLAVAAKRLLVGRYVAETVPAWSGRAMRMWAVRQTVRLVPWRTIAGTEYQSMALRLLGARVGSRVHVHRGADLTQGGWDLLDIGDDVSIGQDASLRLIQLSGGRVNVGPVVLETGSTLDVRAGVGPGSRVGAGARVASLSSVPTGTEVPAGMLADGVPVHTESTAPPVPAVTRTGHRLSPHVHGAALILSQSLLAATTAIPYALLLALVVVLGDLTGAGLLDMIRHPLRHLNLYLAAGPLISAALVASLALSALTVRCLGTVRPGVISRWSPAYIRVWIKSGMVESAGDWLSGTLMWPWWLRAAGMTVSPGCEISTVIDVLPELVSLGTDTFLADGIYLGGPQVLDGVVVLAPLRVGSGVFVGNHSVLPGGSTLPDDLLIGIATPVRRPLWPGTSWFGHPAFELPHREVRTADYTMTHLPPALRRANRWFWELSRFALPVVTFACATLWYAVIDSYRTVLSPGWLPLVTAVVTLGCAVLMCGFVLALKWGLLGRVRPGSHPLWSCWCSRWDFLYVAWQVLAGDILSVLEGTLLLAVYLRRMGMRIGRRVVLGDGFAQVVDPDMIEIGDDATVSAMFQAHTFEDRVLKIDRIRVGDGATLGDNTVPLYGAIVGDGALVAPHSVVMKHEELTPGLRYEGVPTRAVGSPIPPDSLSVATRSTSGASGRA